MTNPTDLILLTGATGYVGGRLLKRLEESGHRMRCMARRPENLSDRVAETTECVKGDVLDRESLRAVMEGVHTAYYLIHSMGTGKDFEDDDRRGARHFAEAAKEAGVRRIIYLGGLGDENDSLSKHLRSRHEVGRELEISGAQVIEFRASIVIGPGSLSFELVRALVRKLPIMLWPKWVSTEASPIAVEDVLAYLTEVLAHPIEENKVYEIGGPDRISYGGIMQEYAKQRGLRRFTIPVPFLSPRLSSLWLGLVTPVYARIGRKLVESLKNPTVVTDDAALKAFSIRPRGVSEAIAQAIERGDQEMALTRWSDALSSSGPVRRWGGVKFRDRLVDSRTRTVAATPEQAFVPVQRIGGKTGWYYGNWLWKLRGFLDLLVGGVGLRRGRRHSSNVRVGDTIDCWRVELFEPNQRLRLCAEMKLPGRAWLDFEISTAKSADQTSATTIRQTAEFDPVGMLGIIYWYSIWPLHQFVFAGMLKGIARAAEQLAREQQTSPASDGRSQPRSQLPEAEA